MKIIILCAGRGSRLGNMTDYIPKAMITINRKPIISYILDHIFQQEFNEDNIEIAIAVGYKHEILRNYLNDFYPNKNLNIIQVDHYQGQGSGPGYSLMKMKDFVNGEPFILILGDTLCFDNLNIFISDHSTIGVYSVNNTERFTTCEVNENLFIKNFYDKVKDAPSKLAIIGIYYIKESALYFEGLEKTKEQLIKNELQISNGLNYLIKHNIPIKAINATWLDAGITETLHSTRKCLGDCDVIYKNNSLTIIQEDKVRKYGFDNTFDDFIKYYKEIQNFPFSCLYDKTIHISEKHPKYCDFDNYKGQKLTPIFLENIVSKDKSLAIVKNVITKLNKLLHSSKKEAICIKDLEYQYKTTTKELLKADKFTQNFSQIPKLIINGENISNPLNIIKITDIKQLTPAYFTPIHGKLYFGNILYNLNNDTFRFIYPGIWFGNSFLYGDYTYDLAMLKQCFNGKYNMIKANRFELKALNDYEFEFSIHRNELLNHVNKHFNEIVSDLYFYDKDLLDRINLLEPILFLKNISQVESYNQKLAFFLTAALLSSHNSISCSI